MDCVRRQRGFLLIVAVVLIAVAATMAAIIVTLTTSSGQAGAAHTESARALLVAESGLEKGIRQRSLSNVYVGEGPTLSGPGTFTVSVFATDFDGVTALVSGRRRIRSVGTVGSSSRTVEAIVRTGPAMIVYAEETSPGVPVYRQWNNDTYVWGARATANDVGPIVQYMVLKFARTRNEAILGTMNSNGDIHVQVWNGTSWGAIRLLATVGTTNDNYRGFDIEYETVNDRAIVVFNNANSRNPGYQVWDGTAWSATTSITLGGTYSSSNNEPLWIELAANPLGTSNEIVMITLDDGSQVYGAHWDGSTNTWSRLVGGGNIWDTTAAPDTTKAIDVAYEQLSGRAMFIWGDSTADNQTYMIANGVNLLVGAVLNIPTQGGTASWIKLAPRPDSNQIMYAVEDSGADLSTALWDGVSAFTVHAEHDGTLENAASMNFDFVFDTHPTRAGRGWLLWGNGSTVSTREWNGTAATWNATVNVAGSDDTSFIRLMAHPGSGNVHTGIYENNGSGGGTQDDIYTTDLTQAAAVWPAMTQQWNGGTVADPVRFRIDIAAERYSPIVSWREVFP